jgi:hypothetical protein
MAPRAAQQARECIKRAGWGTDRLLCLGEKVRGKFPYFSKWGQNGDKIGEIPLGQENKKDLKPIKSLSP